MYIEFYKGNDVVAQEPVNSALLVLSVPDFVKKVRSYGARRGACTWALFMGKQCLISRQAIPTTKE